MCVCAICTTFTSIQQSVLPLSEPKTAAAHFCRNQQAKLSWKKATNEGKWVSTSTLFLVERGGGSASRKET